MRAVGGDLIVNSIPTDGHLTKIFCLGAGDLPFDIIQHVISVRSLESRKNRKSGNFLYFISASASVLLLFPHLLVKFWNLNTVHSLDTGDKIYDAQTLFVALYIKC